MELTYQTRFSFLGQSGWKSKASKDAALLFDPVRMARRFELFEKITLTSLKSQTDPNFKLILLTAHAMPAEFLQQLKTMTHDILGEERIVILQRAPRIAGKIFRGYVQKTYAPEQQICQVVLDDDDAVSHDFTEICKAEGNRAMASDYDNDPTKFLSFARGATLYVEEGKLKHLSDKHSPMINLGLTLVSRADTKKHPFLTSHLAIGRRHPSLVINSMRPFYLRTVHDHNDSRSPHKTDWMTDEEVKQVAKHFPFLRDHFPQKDSQAA